MDDVRYYLVCRKGEKLTKEELSKGWHFCPEWDGMQIGTGMVELDYCGCVKAQIKEGMNNG